MGSPLEKECFTFQQARKNMREKLKTAFEKERVPFMTNSEIEYMTENSITDFHTGRACSFTKEGEALSTKVKLGEAFAKAEGFFMKKMAINSMKVCSKTEKLKTKA